MYIMHNLQYYFQFYLFLYIQLLIDYTSCYSFNQTNSKELFYSINEESEIGSYIGNLKLDAEKKFFMNLMMNENNLPTFELYDDTNKNLFRIEETSGKLFVASRIDRETLCPQPDMIAEEFNGLLLNDQRSILSSSSSSSSMMDSRSNEILPPKECQIHLTVCISRIHWINTNSNEKPF
ncbi:unnamed protein product [Schistosoma turkestanicum]|nr:unnamed protein product [Schistosoma turkestanicum]